MAPVVPNPAAIRPFASAAAFEAWLAAHHDTQTELWLKLYKKASGVPTVSYREAVEVALCWGWIDGLRKSLDNEAFLQRFTPRKAKSIWSQVNRDLVAALTTAGRMTPHGQRHVDAAMADGRWDAAYPRAADMVFPPELRAAIAANPAAEATFAGLNRQNLYVLAFRLHDLKTPAARARTIAAMVEMLARGETPYPNGTARARKTPTP